MAFDLYNGVITRTRSARKVNIRSDIDICGKNNFEVYTERFRVPYTRGTEVLFGRGIPSYTVGDRVVFWVKITGKGFVDIREVALFEDWQNKQFSVKPRTTGSRRG